MTKILLLEVNEICHDLIEHFSQQNLMPNMARLFAKSHYVKTLADAEPPALEPWIQWYSAHTGLTYATHQVFRLTEGARAGHKDIWEALADKGYKVMNFGSMNCKPCPEGHFYLPDPWNKEKANPAEMQIFADFIAKNIQEYTNDRPVFGPEDYLKIVAFLLKNGLRLCTIWQILRQLLSEKLNGQNSYKRVFILNRLYFDVFSYHLKRRRPDFATFFTNSVAHIQHAYWRDFAPEKFAFTGHDKSKSEAMQAAYTDIDKMVGKIMQLAESLNMQIILASALSQQPYLKEEDSGGRLYYRPKDVDKLLKIIDIAPASYEPVMTHQYILRFNQKEDEERAKDILSQTTLTVDGNTSILLRHMESEGGFLFDCAPRTLVPDNATIKINQFEGNFYDIFYKIDEVKSGFHHPEGILLIDKNLRHIPDEVEVSIERLYHIIDENFPD
ncbi:MAG: alkaline phosphatase family protein [Pseudomonadota bacterium]